MKDSQLSDSADEKQEEQPSTCSPGCCCGLDGPGGKLRIGLMVVVVVVTVALMVHGFNG